MGQRRVQLWFAGTLVIAAVMPAAADDQKVPPTCTLEPGPVRTVARVVDGETIVLDDGRAVRLIGALAPRARDAGAAAGAWPPEAEAINALSDLVLGKRVKLAFGGRRSDRYGRVLAQVFVEDNSEEWVQGRLLAGGRARAYGLPESFACSRELLAHEAQAREMHNGLWMNGVYRLMPADRPAVLMQLRGRYERVIGKVASVGHTKTTTYLNFGADWKTDFTARIGKAALSSKPELANFADGLAGKTVVVRGWIERRNGPLVDVEDASQLEVLNSEPAPAEISSDTGLTATEPASAPSGKGSGDRGQGDQSPKEVRPAPPEGAGPGAVNL